MNIAPKRGDADGLVDYMRALLKDEPDADISITLAIAHVLRERDELRALVQGVVDCVKHERTNKHGTFVELHISDTDYVFTLGEEEDRRGSPIFAAVRAIYRYVKGIE